MQDTQPTTAARPNRVPVTDQSVATLPYGIEFQTQLLRLITVDSNVAHVCINYLEPRAFTNEALAWGFQYVLSFAEKYGHAPTMSVLLHEANKLQRVAELYHATLERVAQVRIEDSEYLKNETLEFIRKNIFTRAHSRSQVLYNQGKADEAYSLMREQMAKIDEVSFNRESRSFFFAEFDQRMAKRYAMDPAQSKITTGYPTLDSILEGGLGLGELGCWIADAKTGKTTMLVNIGVNAVQANRKVLHVNLEGPLQYVLDRYEACITGRSYKDLKFGNVHGQDIERIRYDYEFYPNNLVIRSLSENWEADILAIENELIDLRSNHDWVPDLIIIDYGDILKPRHRTNDRWQGEFSVYQDLKSLANRGFAVWTAAQARRPKAEEMDTPRIVTRGQIAGVYDKIRIVDFAGSLNSIPDERERLGMMRVFAEIYRDNQANKVWTLKTYFDRMKIAEEPGVMSPYLTQGAMDQTTPKLGYENGPRPIPAKLDG